MTLHSDVEYACEKCGAAFIPIVKMQKCPRCGHEAPAAFELFVYATNSSALYNLSYGSFLPGVWGEWTLGDRYYDIAFRFLFSVSKELKIPQRALPEQDFTEDSARALTADFLNKSQVEPEYIRGPMLDYLSRVLSTLKKDAPGIIKRREDFYKRLAQQRNSR